MLTEKPSSMQQPRISQVCDHLLLKTCVSLAPYLQDSAFSTHTAAWFSALLYPNTERTNPHLSNTSDPN